MRRILVRERQIIHGWCWCVCYRIPHFPRAVLDEIGGWDPFNVTEDADLGIRLSRLGWHTAVLDSTTWEEAPRYAGQWIRQRTRWLKGWMQTLDKNFCAVKLMS
jgi:cellulose synthase/poly-beta-1,6-N-acetylglucosamine synthase-like glycosyltransferase